MTIYEFHHLKDTAQLRAVWSNGVCVGTRSAGAYRFELMQIDGFYVELKYLAIDDVLLTYKTYFNSDLLHSYIEQIDISGLIKT